MALREGRRVDGRIRLIGVQAGGAAAYPMSLAAGRPVALTSKATMADGIAIGRPGDVPFDVIADADGFDAIRTVSEEELSRALVLTLERAKLVVEPAGAAGVAAVLADPGDFEPPVVVVLSGGNVDPLLLSRVIRHGLIASARYLCVTVRFADRPGSLAALVACVAGTGANVLEVVHRRTSDDLGVNDVEVAIDLETRGPAHRDQILDLLRSSGYLVAL